MMSTTLGEGAQCQRDVTVGPGPVDGQTGAPSQLDRPAGWLALRLGLLAGAIFLCYANGLDVPFLFDDKAAIVESKYVRSLWPLSSAMSAPKDTTGTGRPILNLSLAINYALNGLDATGYHVANILFHTVSAFLLYGALRRLLRRPALARFNASADGLALAIALIWAVHPVHTQAVTYIVQRAESLAAMFYLAAVYAAVRSFGMARPLVWRVVSVVAVVLATLTKEMAATAPFIIYAIDAVVACRGRWLEPLRRRWAFHAALWAALVPLAIIMSQAPRGATAGFGAREVLPWHEFLLAQPRVFTTYFQIAAAPVNLCFDYAMRAAPGWRGVVPYAILPGGALLATLVLVLRRRAAALAGIWFFVILSPTHSLIPVSELIFEYRLYLPLAGLVAFAVLGMYALTTPAQCHEAGTPTLRRRRWRMLHAGMIAAAAFVLAALTHLRNDVFASEISIWSDTVQKQPGNGRAHCNLAMAYVDAGDLARAEASFRAAIAMAPSYEPPYVSLAVLLSDRGEYEAALALLHEAVALQDASAPAHYNLGIVLARLGREDEAVESYRRALERDADFADPAYNLGNLALRRQDHAEAERWFREALSRRPDHVRSNFNLAGLLLARGETQAAQAHARRAFEAALVQAREAVAMGRPGDAIESYGLAIHANPAAADVHVKLATLLRDMGRREEAAAAAAEALRLRPDHAGAKAMLEELKATAAPRAGAEE